MIIIKWGKLQKRHSHTLLVGMKITFGNVYQNNIMTLSFDQAIPLTEISLKDKKKKENKTKKLNAQVIRYITICNNKVLGNPLGQGEWTTVHSHQGNTISYDKE